MSKVEITALINQFGNLVGTTRTITGMTEEWNNRRVEVLRYLYEDKFEVCFGVDDAAMNGMEPKYWHQSHKFVGNWIVSAANLS